jgi:hypothetical protein
MKLDFGNQNKGDSEKCISTGVFSYLLFIFLKLI